MDSTLEVLVSLAEEALANLQKLPNKFLMPENAIP